MFITYFEPIYFRNRSDIYIPYFYKLIQCVGYENLYFLTNEDFFKDIEEWRKESLWNLSETVQIFHDFKYPNNKILDRCHKDFIPSEIFNDLLNQIGENLLEGERILLTETYEPLEKYFDKTIKNIISEYNVEGILTAKNCPSLEKVAEKHNIPVIHYELGGLRPYDYQFLMYFDYKGVNGNTSADIELDKFINEYEYSSIDLLSNNEILELLSRNGFEYKNKTDEAPYYKIGAALQVFNDSNIIAFANEYNSDKLIDFLKEKFYLNNIIIRNHPSTKEEKLLTFNNIDSSLKAVDFINKCEKIITINSSVAFEAALYDKPVYILGDSPYKMLSEDLSTLTVNNYKVENNLLRKLKINFLTFVYMIPYELFFNIEYLRFRLKNPSTIEIFNYHINYYKNKKKELSIELIPYLKQEIENLKLNSNQINKYEKFKIFLNRLLSIIRKHLLIFKI